jgi:hypothetical protein
MQISDNSITAVLKNFLLPMRPPLAANCGNHHLHGNVDHESAHTILFGARKHPPKLLFHLSAPTVLQVA